ncbi:MAG: RNA polymerase sigma factor [Ruminococcus sp.]|nr:RNA polymerase sigma factor [Ruminococcus sp.]
MTDSELEQALEIHRSAVYRLAVSYTGNAADSEDITEEAFIKLYLRHKPLDSEQSTRAWLIRVTANLCKNHLRRLRRRPTAQMPEDVPDNSGISQEERQELKAALESLKPDYRAVILLYYYEGLSVSQTAAALGLTVTAVTTRLQRGRQTLKKFLNEEQDG